MLSIVMHLHSDRFTTQCVFYRTCTLTSFCHFSVEDCLHVYSDRFVTRSSQTEQCVHYRKKMYTLTNFCHCSALLTCVADRFVTRSSHTMCNNMCIDKFLSLWVLSVADVCCWQVRYRSSQTMCNNVHKQCVTMYTLTNFCHFEC